MAFDESTSYDLLYIFLCFVFNWDDGLRLEVDVISFISFPSHILKTQNFTDPFKALLQKK